MQLLMVAAAVAQTFNLNCSGTLESNSFFSGRQSKPYNSVYRIDLAKNQWCEGECKGLFPIVSAQPTSLTLERKEVDSPSETSVLSNSIDRENGQHHILSTYKNPRERTSIMIMEWKGQCERQPFTGFPAFETKF